MSIARVPYNELQLFLLCFSATTENGIWWIGKFDPTLSKLSYGSTSHETDNTERCFAIGTGVSICCLPVHAIHFVFVCFWILSNVQLLIINKQRASLSSSSLFLFKIS